MTGVAQNTVAEELKITEDDVIPTEPWKAHDDGINCVTYIPELQLIATCSFDYHVYVWNAEGEKREKVGSLLLGNKVLPPGQKPDADMRKYKAQWKISIDKMTRYHQEMEEAREMLARVDEIDYN